MRSYDDSNTDHEEALFAVLMDELMHREGSAFLSENEYLKETLDDNVFQNLDRRSIETIQKQFNNKSAERKLGNIKSICRKTMTAMIIITCLFGVTFLTIPSVKAKTLNLLMQLTEKSTLLFIENGNAATVSGIEDNFGYVINYIPDGFYLSSESKTDQCVMYRYENDAEDYISIRIINGADYILNSVDTENANSVETISSDGRNGLLIDKNGNLQLAIMDLGRNYCIDIVCVGVDKPSVLAIALEIESKK